MIRSKSKKKTQNRLAPQRQATVRVAIYTRKSVTEGLDQEFNTLDAQREAVEAYTLSQRGEGWEALPEHYDDGGFTGSNIDRPAFQRLLQDIEAGKVDVVAVYKIDRLSRSLADFARLIELFTHHGVTFISVTQQFNTTNSMGKLTLNILMSFAEFERETISERTRDKILASRKRGLWTGGRPVLGYDVIDKKLVVNEVEAEQVRGIFNAYLELGSLLSVVDELKLRAWATKTWTNKKGALTVGRSFNKDSVRSLLTNPLYLGKVRCNGDLHEGVHEGIIDEALWHSVSEQLKDNAGGRAGRRKRQHNALLAGIVRCGTCGSGMSPHHSRKGDRSYAYYVCQRIQKEGANACPGSRVAAGDLEGFVIDRIRAIGSDPGVLAATLEADKRDREARQPELAAEGRRLTAEMSRLKGEQRNSADAIAQGGAGTPLLLQRLDEVNEAMGRIDRRARGVRSEVQAIELGAIEPDELRSALAELEPIWSELFPKERARVLALLIDEVRFDAANAEVAITFRPGGPRALWARESGGPK